MDVSLIVWMSAQACADVWSVCVDGWMDVLLSSTIRLLVSVIFDFIRSKMKDRETGGEFQQQQQRLHSLLLYYPFIVPKSF